MPQPFATLTLDVEAPVARITLNRPERLNALSPELMLELIAQRFPQFATYTDAQRDSTREDFDYILQFVEAALLTDDPTIVAEFVQWLTRLLTARDLPASVVPLSLDVLHDCLAPQAAEARGLLRRSYTPIIPDQYGQGGRVGPTPRRH